MDLGHLWAAEPGWLNTASYGLPPTVAWDELQAALADWRHGRTSWEAWGESSERARRAFARLVGVAAADVTIGSTVSQLLAPVAGPEVIPDGGHVVVAEGDFSSVVYPWLTRGLRVTAVDHPGLADAIVTGVDAVAFSAVRADDGTIAELATISAAARAVGAWVIVDATQACGWLPIDASLADVVVAHAYKWLMSPRGTALGYLAPTIRERMRPGAAGWYAAPDVHGGYFATEVLRLADDARRFDISPAWQAWVGTAPALELVERIGVAAIHDHDVGLANRFLTGLGQPPGASAIVTVDGPGAAERLAAAGVRAAVRNGRVRASFHIYTTVADVDLALAALTA